MKIEKGDSSLLNRQFAEVESMKATRADLSVGQSDNVASRRPKSNGSAYQIISRSIGPFWAFTNESSKNSK